MTEGLIDLDLDKNIVLFAVTTGLSVTLSSSGVRLLERHTPSHAVPVCQVEVVVGTRPHRGVAELQCKTR